MVRYFFYHKPFLSNQTQTILFVLTSGDTYFFKDSNYWILKRGGLDQESASPKSIATDWMKCDGHISTHTPEISRGDKDCTCVQSTAAMICVLSSVIYSIIIVWILALMFY